MIGDAAEVELPYADCIIFGDVLEHMEKNTALELLERAVNDYRHVVISIPIDGSGSKIHYGNKYEAHLSQWTYDELKDLYNWEVRFTSGGIGVFCK